MASAELGDRLPLPTGVCALLTKYGENQADAIENCIEVQPQLPPLFSELVDGDIVVAVEAAEVVWTDSVMATGQYQHQAKTPYSPGMTYAGTVAWATDRARAAGVDVGSKVAIAGNAGPRSLGRYQKWGGCANYAVAPVSAARPVPEHWSMEQSACFAYGYDTVHYCLVECGKLQKGESILIHGAGGGVGIPAVRMAKMMGATVIATSRSASKVEFLKSIGADHVVVITDDKGAMRKFRSDVKDLVGGKGVDVVYDGVGGDAVTVESMHCIRFGGRLLIVGWAATPNVAAGGGKGRGSGAPNPNRIPTNLIMMKGLQVIGCPAMISTTFDKSLIPRRLKDVGEWTTSGKLPPPVIASTHPLADVKKALIARVESGGEVGSTIVCPPPLQLPLLSKL